MFPCFGAVTVLLAAQAALIEARYLLEKDKKMTDKLTEAFSELTKKAEKIAKSETWVQTGIMPSQNDAMLAALWLEIKTLRAEIVDKFCRHGENFKCSLCAEKEGES